MGHSLELLFSPREKLHFGLFLEADSPCQMYLARGLKAMRKKFTLHHHFQTGLLRALTLSHYQRMAQDHLGSYSR